MAKRVRGEEEIPDGTVAVLTPDMPDVLSHVSVRARNSKVITLNFFCLHASLLFNDKLDCYFSNESMSCNIQIQCSW